MKRALPIFFLSLIILSACYRVDIADDELRTVPVTNNHNLIPDANKTASTVPPGVGY